MWPHVQDKQTSTEVNIRTKCRVMPTQIIYYFQPNNKQGANTRVITVQTLYWWRNLGDWKCVEEKNKIDAGVLFCLTCRERAETWLFSLQHIHESGKANLRWEQQGGVWGHLLLLSISFSSTSNLNHRTPESLSNPLKITRQIWGDVAYWVNDGDLNP